MVSPNPTTAGTLIKAIGSYCYTPAFGQFIGLGLSQFTFQKSAFSGVPKIDLMLCVDISGGMDDDSSVSFYQRYEAPNGTSWMVNPNPGSPGSLATGTLASSVCSGNNNGRWKKSQRFSAKSIRKQCVSVCQS